MKVFSYLAILLMWITWEWRKGRLGLLAGSLSGKYSISPSDYKGEISNLSKLPGGPKKTNG